MKLNEIKNKSTLESKIEFLKKVIKEYAKDKNFDDYSFERWIRNIENSCEYPQFMEEEAGYTISYQNIQILDPYQTEDGRPFRISVWMAEYWDIEEEKKISCDKMFYAFNWEE